VADGWTARRGVCGPARPALLLALALSLVVGMVTSARPASADDAPRSSVITGWLPSWATTQALAGIEANANLLGEASPFWYTAKASGGSVALTPAVGAVTMTTVLDSLRARGIKVIPSVADGSAARAMAALIKDPAARAAHVAQLVDLVVANAYDGIELDYEKFAFSDGSSTWPTTRPAWVAFVTDLGNALHAAGKVLALAVPPIYDGSQSSSSGYWVYDYAGVAPVVDSLRIMTYDYSVSRPGPISPLSFIRRTLDYAVTAFPAARIRMGVPAYGRLWIARRADGSKSITGTCPTSGVPGTTSFTAAAAVEYLTSVAGTLPVIRYDETTAESVATFSREYAGTGADGSATTCTVDHEAWWVDSRGVNARLPFVGQYGLAGAAVWHLGGVDPDSWAAMQAYAAGQPFTPTPPPTAEPPAPAPPPSTSAATVTVKVSTYRPKRGKKLKVRAYVAPAKKKVLVKRQMLVKGKWKTVAKKRTTSKGRATFTIRWPKKKSTTITYRIKSNKRGSLGAGLSEKFTIKTR
jgi:spore germination protein YaaH